MSNTDDQYAATKWKLKGYYAGLYGEPKADNPRMPGTNTWYAWDAGWRNGHAASERMKKRKVRAI